MNFQKINLRFYIFIIANIVKQLINDIKLNYNVLIEIRKINKNKIR